MRQRKLITKKRGILYKKRLYIIIIGIILLLVWLSFSWRSFFLDHNSWVPKSGGILTESLVGTTQNISPLSINNSRLDLDIKQLIFAGLVQHNPTTGIIEDGLATLRVSENGRTYFLTLKNSAKFSNGESVTLDDVLFTYEDVIQNPRFDNEPLKDAFEYVTLDVIDSKTISFNLTEPNTYFSSLLTAPILRKKSYENALIEEINDPGLPANQKPISAGPFVLKNIIRDSNEVSRIFLERNPHYFGGAAFIDQIVFYAYSSFDYLKYDNKWTTMYAHFSVHEIEEIEPSFYGEYYRKEYVLPRFTGIFFNLDRTLPANPNIREALKLSINKESAINREKGWIDIDSVFFFEGVEGWQETNYQSARTLLRDRGFPYSNTREIRLSDDTPVQLKMITSTAPAIYSRLAQNIARTWERELDIIIDLEVLSPPDFQQALRERTYDLVFFGQNFSENPDSLSSWHSSQSGESNLANLTNNDVDFLIEEFRLTGAISDLLALNQELDQINPVIPIATPQYYLLVDKDLLGFSKTFGNIRKHAERFFDANTWHFEKKRDWDLPPNVSKISAYMKWLFTGEKSSNTPELDYRELLPEDFNEEN